VTKDCSVADGGAHIQKCDSRGGGGDYFWYQFDKGKGGARASTLDYSKGKKTGDPKETGDPPLGPHLLGTLSSIGSYRTQYMVCG